MSQIKAIGYCAGCKEPGAVWIPEELARKLKNRKKPYNYDRFRCDCLSPFFVLTKIECELEIPQRGDPKALKTRSVTPFYRIDNYKEL